MSSPSRMQPGPQRKAKAVKRRVAVSPAAESPLSWLRQRRDKDDQPLLSDAQFLAGERLRADFTYGQMMPRVTASWSGVPTGQHERRVTPGVGIEMRDNVVAAQERVRRALTAVGPDLCGILIDVCCLLKGLAHAEQAGGLPQRSRKVVLQIALTSLARHYGLLRADGAEARHAAIRHWGASGYRPAIDLPGDGVSGERIAPAVSG